MTEKNDPHVVVTGPYRLVRHPIYSGLLLAGAGTAVAFNLSWLIGVAIALGYFIYAARQEEHYLSLRLPTIYPPYKRSTKMLVPFVL
jgi:protein-S-isoprenylcysteine O-methyltransferase Ste14